MEKEKNGFSLIKRNASSMSEVEQKIANFILQNQTKVIYMTTKALAKKIGVSEGSIIKFSTRLGFTGFSQLKINLAQQLAPENNYIFDTIAAGDSPKAALRKMTDNAIAAMEATYEAVSEQELKSITDVLMNVKGRIEIYGVGSSSFVADDIYYRLMRLGLPIYAVTDPHISSVSASMLDETCVAIGISHSGRTVETLSTMETAKSKQAATICVTGYAGSPLEKLCDHSIVIASRESELHKEAVTARLAQLLVFDSICAFISRQREEQSVALMDNVIDIIGEHRKPE